MATKEQIKSRVSFLNSVASSGLIASFATPAVNLLLGNPLHVDPIVVGSVAVLGIVFCLILHDQAYRAASLVKD